MTFEPLSTRRVQRFNAKPETEFSAKATQAFGGGMLQLREEAWEVLQSVVDIHYMGAAEYEFGALPRCLGAMVEDRERMKLWDFVIEGKKVKPDWWRKDAVQSLRRAEIAKAKQAGEKPKRMSPKHRRELEAKAGVKPIEDRQIFVIAAQPEEQVKKLIFDVGTEQFRVKGSPGFDLDPNPRWQERNPGIGWLDLDNQICWFLEREVRDSFAEILGIEKNDPDLSSGA